MLDIVPEYSAGEEAERLARSLQGPQSFILAGLLSSGLRGLRRIRDLSSTILLGGTQEDKNLSWELAYYNSLLQS